MQSHCLAVTTVAREGRRSRDRIPSPGKPSPRLAASSVPSSVRGFTLIELLVVVAIIGILAAIAIPQFAAYRQRGFDARAVSDIRTAATAEEAVYATTSAYVDLPATVGPAKPSLLPGLNISATVTVQMTANGQTFTGSAKSNAGSGVTCSWNSSAGGLTGFLGCN
jgi:type IV pilus assembly protein PilA